MREPYIPSLRSRPIMGADLIKARDRKETAAEGARDLLAAEAVL